MPEKSEKPAKTEKPEKPKDGDKKPWYSPSRAASRANDGFLAVARSLGSASRVAGSGTARIFRGKQAPGDPDAVAPDAPEAQQPLPADVAPAARPAVVIPTARPADVAPVASPKDAAPMARPTGTASLAAATTAAIPAAAAPAAAPRATALEREEDSEHRQMIEYLEKTLRPIGAREVSPEDPAFAPPAAAEPELEPAARTPSALPAPPWLAVERQPEQTPPRSEPLAPPPVSPAPKALPGTPIVTAPNPVRIFAPPAAPAPAPAPPAPKNAGRGAVSTDAPVGRSSTLPLAEAAVEAAVVADESPPPRGRDPEDLMLRHQVRSHAQRIRIRAAVEDLVYGSERTRAIALARIEALGPEASPFLVDALQRTKPEVMLPAITCLLRIVQVPQLPPLLSELLEAGDPDLRLVALRAMHRVPDAQARPLLLRAARDPLPALRRRVVSYLTWRRRAAWAVVEIRKLVDDVDPTVRLAALQAMSFLRPDESRQLLEDNAHRLGQGLRRLTGSLLRRGASPAASSMAEAVPAGATAGPEVSGGGRSAEPDRDDVPTSGAALVATAVEGDELPAPGADTPVAALAEAVGSRRRSRRGGLPSTGLGKQDPSFSEEIDRLEGNVGRAPAKLAMEATTPTTPASDSGARPARRTEEPKP